MKGEGVVLGLITIHRPVWAHRHALVLCPQCCIVVLCCRHSCCGCHIAAGKVAPGFGWAFVFVLGCCGGLFVHYGW